MAHLKYKERQPDGSTMEDQGAFFSALAAKFSWHAGAAQEAKRNFEKMITQHADDAQSLAASMSTFSKETETKLKEAGTIQEMWRSLQALESGFPYDEAIFTACDGFIDATHEGYDALGRMGSALSNRMGEDGSWYYLHFRPIFNIQRSLTRATKKKVKNVQNLHAIVKPKLSREKLSPEDQALSQIITTAQEFSTFHTKVLPKAKELLGKLEILEKPSVEQTNFSEAVTRLQENLQTFKQDAKANKAECMQLICRDYAVLLPSREKFTATSALADELKALEEQIQNLPANHSLDMAIKSSLQNQMTRIKEAHSAHQQISFNDLSARIKPILQQHIDESFSQIETALTSLTETCETFQKTQAPEARITLERYCGQIAEPEVGAADEKEPLLIANVVVSQAYLAKRLAELEQPLAYAISAAQEEQDEIALAAYRARLAKLNAEKAALDAQISGLLIRDEDAKAEQASSEEIAADVVALPLSLPAGHIPHSRIMQGEPLDAKSGHPIHFATLTDELSVVHPGFLKANPYAEYEALWTTMAQLVAGKDTAQGRAVRDEKGRATHYFSHTVGGLMNWGDIFRLCGKNPATCTPEEKQLLLARPNIFRVLDIDRADYDFANLAKILVTELYTLNDDITRRNLVIGAQDRFVSFDHDMRFWSATFAWALPNKSSLLARGHLVSDPSIYFPTDACIFAENIYDSPCFTARNGGFQPFYGPHCPGRGTAKNTWTHEEAAWFQRLIRHPQFIKEKYKYLLKCLLITPDTVARLTELHLSHPEQRAKVVAGFRAYQDFFRKTLVEHSPEFRIHVLRHFAEYRDTLLEEFAIYRQPDFLGASVVEDFAQEKLTQQLTAIHSACFEIYRKEVLEKMEQFQARVQVQITPLLLSRLNLPVRILQTLQSEWQLMQTAARTYDEKALVLRYQNMRKIYEDEFFSAIEEEEITQQIRALFTQFNQLTCQIAIAYSSGILLKDALQAHLQSEFLQDWLQHTAAEAFHVPFGVTLEKIERINTALAAKPPKTRVLQHMLTKVGINLSLEDVGKVKAESLRKLFLKPLSEILARKGDLRIKSKYARWRRRTTHDCIMKINQRLQARQKIKSADEKALAINETQLRNLVEGELGIDLTPEEWHSVLSQNPSAAVSAAAVHIAEIVVPEEAKEHQQAAIDIKTEPAAEINPVDAKVAANIAAPAASAIPQVVKPVIASQQPSEIKIVHQPRPVSHSQSSQVPPLSQDVFLNDLTRPFGILRSYLSNTSGGSDPNGGGFIIGCLAGFTDVVALFTTVPVSACYRRYKKPKHTRKTSNRELSSNQPKVSDSLDDPASSQALPEVTTVQEIVAADDPRSASASPSQEGADMMPIVSAIEMGQQPVVLSESEALVLSGDAKSASATHQPEAASFSDFIHREKTDPEISTHEESNPLPEVERPSVFSKDDEEPLSKDDMVAQMVGYEQKQAQAADPRATVALQAVNTIGEQLTKLSSISGLSDESNGTLARSLLQVQTAIIKNDGELLATYSAKVQDGCLHLMHDFRKQKNPKLAEQVATLRTRFTFAVAPLAPHFLLQNPLLRSWFEVGGHKQGRGVLRFPGGVTLSQINGINQCFAHPPAPKKLRKILLGFGIKLSGSEARQVNQESYRKLFKEPLAKIVADKEKAGQGLGIRERHGSFWRDDTFKLIQRTNRCTAMIARLSGMPHPDQRKLQTARAQLEQFLIKLGIGLVDEERAQVFGEAPPKLMAVEYADMAPQAVINVDAPLSAAEVAAPAAEINPAIDAKVAAIIAPEVSAVHLTDLSSLITEAKSICATAAVTDFSLPQLSNMEKQFSDYLSLALTYGAKLSEAKDDPLNTELEGEVEKLQEFLFGGELYNPQNNIWFRQLALVELASLRIREKQAELQRIKQRLIAASHAYHAPKSKNRTTDFDRTLVEITKDLRVLHNRQEALVRIMQQGTLLQRWCEIYKDSSGQERISQLSQETRFLGISARRLSSKKNSVTTRTLQLQTTPLLKARTLVLPATKNIEGVYETLNKSSMPDMNYAMTQLREMEQELKSSELSESALVAIERDYRQLLEEHSIVSVCQEHGLSMQGFSSALLALQENCDRVAKERNKTLQVIMHRCYAPSKKEKQENAHIQEINMAITCAAADFSAARDTFCDLYRKNQEISNEIARQKQRIFSERFEKDTKELAAEINQLQAQLACPADQAQQIQQRIEASFQRVALLIQQLNENESILSPEQMVENLRRLQEERRKLENITGLFYIVYELERQLAALPVENDLRANLATSLTNFKTALSRNDRKKWTREIPKIRNGCLHLAQQYKKSHPQARQFHALRKRFTEGITKYAPEVLLHNQYLRALLVNESDRFPHFLHDCRSQQISGINSLLAKPPVTARLRAKLAEFGLYLSVAEAAQVKQASLRKLFKGPLGKIVASKQGLIIKAKRRAGFSFGRRQSTIAFIQAANRCAATIAAPHPTQRKLQQERIKLENLLIRLGMDLTPDERGQVFCEIPVAAADAAAEKAAVVEQVIAESSVASDSRVEQKQAPQQTSAISFPKFTELLWRVGNPDEGLTFATFFPNEVCAMARTAVNPSDELTASERVAFLDTLALIGAIRNPSANGSDLLLARLVILCHGRLQAAVAGADKSWEKLAALATAFCHGGRIEIEYDGKDAQQADLFTWLTQGTGLATRQFSTHDLVYDPKTKRFKERKKKFGKAAAQYGLSVAMYGEHSAHPLTGAEVSSNGIHGELLVLHHPPSKKTNHRGAIAFGIEGSRALKHDPFGQLHSPTGKAPKIAVTGSGGKFPQAAQNVGVTFASPDAKHPKNDLLSVDLTSIAGDMALPDDPEQLRRAAISALFPEGAAPKSNSDFAALEDALQTVNLMQAPAEPVTASSSARNSHRQLSAQNPPAAIEMTEFGQQKAAEQSTSVSVPRESKYARLLKDDDDLPAKSVEQADADSRAAIPEPADSLFTTVQACISGALPDDAKHFDYFVLLDQEMIDSKEIEIPDDHPLESGIYNWLIKLSLANDFAHGINAYIVRCDDGSHCYVRDARGINIDQIRQAPSATSYNYIIMGLNYTLALSSLLKAQHVQFDEKALHQLAERFYTSAFMQAEQKSATHAPLDFEHHFLRFVENALAPLAVQHGLASNPDEAIRLLDKAKDWTALEYPPLSVATIDKVTQSASDQDGLVVRIDKPLYQLTDDLKSEFKHPENTAWYKKLKGHEKALFHHYQPLLLAGREIPSQLRSRIPGLKNAFRQDTYAMRGGKAQHLLTAHHCGSLPWLDKTGDVNEMQRTAELNAAQQSAVSGSQRHIMITLNSRMGDRLRGQKSGFDQHIVNRTKEAAQQSNGKMLSANICLNGFRAIEGHDYSGIYTILQEAKEAYRLCQGQLRQFHGQEAQQQLQIMLGQLGARLQQLRSRLRALTRVRRDREVNGIYVIGLTTQITHILRQMRSLTAASGPVYLAEHIPDIAVWFGCASGENRTGITEYHLQCEAIAAAFPDLDREAIRMQLAAGNHVQLITGFQGGNAGMTGIRGKSMDSLPESYGKDVRHLLMTSWSNIKSAQDSIAAPSKKIARMSTKKLRKKLAKGKLPKQPPKLHGQISAPATLEAAQRMKQLNLGQLFIYPLRLIVKQQQAANSHLIIKSKTAGRWKFGTATRKGIAAANKCFAKLAAIAPEQSNWPVLIQSGTIELRQHLQSLGIALPPTEWTQVLASVPILEQQRSAIIETANAICAMNRSLFGQIPDEGFTSTKNEQRRLLISANNQLNQHVQDDILQHQCMHARTFAYERWVHVMANCYAQGDYSGAFAIYDALHSDAIRRLTNTQQGLTIKTKEQLARFARLRLVPDKMFTSLRSDMECRALHGENIVPTLAAYAGTLDKIKTARDKNAMGGEQKISQQALGQERQMISALQGMRERHQDFVAPPEHADWQSRFQVKEEGSAMQRESQRYAKSLLCEPREKPPAPSSIMAIMGDVLLSGGADAAAPDRIVHQSAEVAPVAEVNPLQSESQIATHPHPQESKAEQKIAPLAAPKQDESVRLQAQQRKVAEQKPLINQIVSEAHTQINKNRVFLRSAAQMHNSAHVLARLISDSAILSLKILTAQKELTRDGQHLPADECARYMTPLQQTRNALQENMESILEQYFAKDFAALEQALATKDVFGLNSKLKVVHQRLAPLTVKAELRFSPAIAQKIKSYQARLAIFEQNRAALGQRQVAKSAQPVSSGARVKRSTSGITSALGVEAVIPSQSSEKSQEQKSAAASPAKSRPRGGGNMMLSPLLGGSVAVVGLTVGLSVSAVLLTAAVATAAVAGANMLVEATVNRKALQARAERPRQESDTYQAMVEQLKHQQPSATYQTGLTAAEAQALSSESSSHRPPPGPMAQ